MDWRNIPWNKVYSFLLDCGKEWNHRDFCVRIMESINALVPYNQGRVYFLDSTGKVYDELLFNVDKRWSQRYCEYYSRILEGRYSMLHPPTPNILPGMNDGCQINPSISYYDWTNWSIDEFVNDYIKPQGIRYSLGFGLHDARNLVKKALVIDRTRNVRYTPAEISLLNLIVPLLLNLHRNFYLEPPDENRESALCQRMPLTAREAEIAELLSLGITPTKIAQYLFISLDTVRNHIAHIHKKLDVTNYQELLVKLLNSGPQEPVPDTLFTKQLG